MNRLLDWKLDRLRIPHIMLRRALGLLLFSGSGRVRPDFGFPPYPPLDRPARISRNHRRGSDDNERPQIDVSHLRDAAKTVLGAEFQTLSPPERQLRKYRMQATVLDGRLIGTRPGTLDPGVSTYLMRKNALSAAEIEDVLYNRSGLQGISESMKPLA